MNDFPLVSVLMTAYNREKFIAEAIESVLASSYSNFELIIVDDVSADSTVNIAKRFAASDSRIRVIENTKNLGDYNNRNEAAKFAKGKYLKYVDSDDAVFPHTLQVMVELMELYPDAALGISSRVLTKAQLHTSHQIYQLHFFDRSILDIGPTATIISHDKFKAANGFKGIRNVSDLDMWLRLSAKHPVIEMPRGLVFWREHEGQEIQLATEYYIEYTLAIIEENLKSADCPLSAEQKKTIIRKTRKNTARYALTRLLKNHELGLFTRVRRKYNLRITDFIR